MTEPNKATACDVSDKFFESFGYRMEHIFCSVTGKRLGMFDTDESFATIDMLNPTMDNLEAVCDDIRLRVVASMRPSTRWNKFRSESINDLRIAQPRETLAYLLNRLFEPLNNTGSIWSIEQRIHVWQELEAHEISNSIPRVEQMIHQLLEIDTRTGLTKLFIGFERGMLSGDKFDEFCDAVTQTYEQKQLEWAKLDAEYRYQIQNPLVKQAFFDSFMTRKPESIVKVKEKAKTERRRGFENLLAQIMDEDSQPAQILAATIADDSADNKAHDAEIGVVAIMPSATPRAFTFGVKKD